MDEVLLAGAFSVVAGAVGAWLTYLFWVRQKLVEIRGAYDQELRTRRLTEYAKLWQEFEPLAVYAPEEDLTYAKLVVVGERLRSWYFNDGGLLLTSLARDTYFLVQDALSRLADQAPRAAVLRARDRRWTTQLLRAARGPIGLEDPPAVTAGPKAYKTWLRSISKKIEERTFGANPEQDFVLLQFLATSLRTRLAIDLHSRTASVLDDR